MFTFSWSPYPSDETIHKAVLAGQGNYIKNYHYHPIVLGSVLRSSNNLPGPSYSGIKAETTIYPDVIAEIKDHSVYLNGVLIASAPGKKSKAFKEKFCKAIVWALVNDSVSLHDKLAEISKPAMPEVIPGYIAYLGLSITEEVYA